MATRMQASFGSLAASAIGDLHRFTAGPKLHDSLPSSQKKQKWKKHNKGEREREKSRKNASTKFARNQGQVPLWARCLGQGALKSKLI